MRLISKCAWWVQTAREVGRLPLLALGCAVLLFAASAIRLIILPALLFAPGWSLIYLLCGARVWTSPWSAVVPLSLVMTALVSLLLDVCGVRLDATTLGAALGALTSILVGLGARPYAGGLAALGHREKRVPHEHRARGGRSL
jgi:hypothetical protein